MNDDFRFADWNPKRGTVPAYFPDPDTDIITLGEVSIGDDGEPQSELGPLKSDGTTRTLLGWKHSVCQSFNNGAVLVPLKGSRT